MRIEDGLENLCEILGKQLSSHWTVYDYSVITKAVDDALVCMEKNMSVLNSNCKYVRNTDGCVVFSPYNTVEYGIFLYYLSNCLYKQNHEKEAGLIYYLNKIMNGVEWFYAVNLPTHFWADHPIGSVLGRAHYGDYLFVSQGVTIGGNSIGVLDDKYPTIGKGVTLCANCSVFGDCSIGDNVIISAGALIKNCDIPSNSVVFGISPNLVIKERKPDTRINSLWDYSNE